MVMMMGSSSGMVAKARARPVRNISLRGWPWRTPMAGMAMEKKRATKTRVFARAFMASWRGVLGGRITRAFSEILPMRVPPPVRVASMSPSPETARVPAKSSSPGFFSTGKDSPVREDSSSWRLTPERSLPSAETRVPATRTRRSPGTTSSVGTSVIPPSRRTLVLGSARAAREEMAFLARYSFQISTRTRAMMMA
ncbi:MAG: hypothetical protein LUQ67_03600 [Methanomicrobiales archaeon]|nr:hypothetical protein [Methanomicrobiales archaeon]